MAVSKQLRYTCAVFVAIFSISGILNVIELNKVNPNPYNGYQLYPVLVSISITIITGLLLGLYFYRQKLWVLSAGIIIVDLFNVLPFYFVYLHMNGIDYSNLSAALVNILGALIFPAFCLTILLSKARFFIWLKYYAIFSLVFILSDIVSFILVLEIDFYFFDLLRHFLNLLLILHLLLPDLKSKKKIVRNIEVLDNDMQNGKIKTTL